MFLPIFEVLFQSILGIAFRTRSEFSFFHSIQFASIDSKQCSQSNNFSRRNRKSHDVMYQPIIGEMLFMEFLAKITNKIKSSVFTTMQNASYAQIVFQNQLE